MRTLSIEDVEAVAALGRVHSPNLGVQGLTDVSGDDFRRV